MDQWEYDVVRYDLDALGSGRYRADLMRAGLGGWDVVSIVPIASSPAWNGMTTDLLVTFKRRTLPAQNQGGQPQQAT